MAIDEESRKRKAQPDSRFCGIEFDRRRGNAE